jgi:hypothetical protein
MIRHQYLQNFDVSIVAWHLVPRKLSMVTCEPGQLTIRDKSY